MKKLTTQEAEQLIKMLKKTIEKEIYLPSKGTNSQVVYNHDISGTNTPFKVYQMQVENHIFWVAESKSLKGCVGQGDSYEIATSELEQNEIEWLETAMEFNIPIPNEEYITEKTYSGKVSLRMSPIVHEEASNLAAELGISLNQYINDAILTYNNKVHVKNNKPKNDTITSNVIPIGKKKDNLKFNMELKEN